MKILMLGSPGAGKGTQAKRIAEKYNLPHISTGDIFRKNIQEKTPLGIEVKEFIDNGLLVPDELTVKIVLSRLSEDDCKNGYILDGFPRTLPQAEDLEKALKEHNTALDIVLDMEASADVIIRRNSGRRICPNCGATYHMESHRPKEDNICDNCKAELMTRPDDAPETIKKRLTVYHQNTEPLIQYYRNKNILKSIDANREREDVFADIVKELDQI